MTPPAGPVAPAFAAVRRRRSAEAEKLVARITESTPIDRSWKLLLTGLLSIERQRLADAEPVLLEAFGVAMIETAKPKSDEVGLARLAAKAAHLLGWIHRRQDRPDRARSAHTTAYRLRSEHGSFEEMWETACELGLDEDLARRFAEAQRWYRTAVDHAKRIADEPLRREAVAWTHLATSLTASGEHEQAIDAAQTARRCWQEHDVGSVHASEADAKVGTTLLAYGEQLCDRGDAKAGQVLADAVRWLASARDALLAFGPERVPDAETCRQQEDFARRLRASASPPESSA